MSILEKIVAEKKKELNKYTPQYINHIASRIRLRDKIRPFKSYLRRKGINIIAEIKKASPSKGIIRKDFDPIKIAQIYDKNGAAAISVLTDEKFFQGSIDYILQVRPFTTVPLLRKDFIIDKRQILEAVAYGADSYLLIVKILERQKLKELIKYGKEFNIDPLVEVHTLEEGYIALESGAKVIGINNRNLETFEVDLNVTKEIAPKLKEEGAEVIVSESGINSYEDIKELRKYDVNAFLIGEALMKAENIASKLKEFLGEFDEEYTEKTIRESDFMINKMIKQEENN
jgi:indole-3-glycerol phosphate synthase